MQPSRIHHVGLPVRDLDVSVAWYRKALGLTHEAAAGVPGRVAFMVAPTGERLELLAVPTRVRWRRAATRSGRPATRPSPDGGSRSSLTRTGTSWSCFPATGKLL